MPEEETRPSWSSWASGTRSTSERVSNGRWSTSRERACDRPKLEDLRRPRQGPCESSQLIVLVVQGEHARVSTRRPRGLGMKTASNSRLLASVATYNEVGNLRPLVGAIRQHAPRAE